MRTQNFDERCVCDRTVRECENLSLTNCVPKITASTAMCVVCLCVCGVLCVLCVVCCVCVMCMCSVLCVYVVCFVCVCVVLCVCVVCSVCVCVCVCVLLCVYIYMIRMFVVMCDRMPVGPHHINMNNKDSIFRHYLPSKMNVLCGDHVSPSVCL